MSETPRGVAVCTVTHDDAAHLEGWARALGAVDGAGLGLEVVVVDCASSDDTRERLDRLELPWPTRVVPLDENLGFAGGMNAALAACSASARWVLSLNPDARSEPSAIAALVASHRRWSARGLRIGSVTGRLERDRAPGEPPRLDACGMRLSPTWRHFDRGSGAIDRGQYARAEEVFGGTGAATLYDRVALADVAVEGAVYDADFHTFREDAELAFRLRERGWACVFEPAARVVHRRCNLPERRRRMSPLVNLHSLKNRYLLRLYHQTPLNVLTTVLTAQAREAVIIAAVLLRERSSIDAWRWLWRHRRRLRRRAALIRARRTAPAREIERWFWRDARELPDAGSAR
ncbi:MAG TPA: glycosyltransferase [Thermoanaerobaculia bacterium]|nr:glycosyltransferase [Thermoanaerobaculia bacterium]